MLQFYGLIRCWSIVRKGLQMKKLIPPPNKWTEYVADLGIKLEMRGKGLGTALLKHQMKHAQKRGKKIYALDVASNNPKAQKLYGRFGFQVVHETVFTVKGRTDLIPNIRRMEMKL